MEFAVGEINIICTDLEASLKFYRDILGFTPTQDEDGFYHMQFGDRQYLLLPIAKEKFHEANYGTNAQISMDLYVENIAAAYKYLQTQAVEFAVELGEGRRSFVISDPDGLHWEIIARLP